VSELTDAEMAATDIAALQDRVTALEECIRYPLRMYVPKWEPLTEAQEAEVKESIAEAARIGPLPCTGPGNADLYRAGRGLRPFDLPPLTEEQEARLRREFDVTMQLPLSPDEIRQLLRECVTVVKPGETLIVRGTNWTPGQTRVIQQVMDEMHELGIVPFKALAVFGDELGVAEPAPHVEFAMHFDGDPAAIEEYFSRPGVRKAWAKALSQP
jgi:hypothetical protein